MSQQGGRSGELICLPAPCDCLIHEGLSLHRLITCNVPAFLTYSCCGLIRAGKGDSRGLVWQCSSRGATPPERRRRHVRAGLQSGIHGSQALEWLAGCLCTAWRAPAARRPCALLTAMPAEALSGQVMLGSCRRSAAAAWRALAGRLAPSAATAGDPLLASGRRTHRLDRSAWLSVTAAAAGEWRRQAAAAGGAAAASPAAVAGHPAHSSAPHQQQAVQQAELAHLRQLSEEQLAAVTAPLGTLRVVAGPGSGKVRSLACVPAGGALPEGLLAEAIPCCTRLCMV